MGFRMLQKSLHIKTEEGKTKTNKSKQINISFAAFNMFPF